MLAIVTQEYQIIDPVIHYSNCGRYVWIVLNGENRRVYLSKNVECKPLTSVPLNIIVDENCTLMYDLERWSYWFFKSSQKTINSRLNQTKRGN